VVLQKNFIFSATFFLVKIGEVDVTNTLFSHIRHERANEHHKASIYVDSLKALEAWGVGKHTVYLKHMVAKYLQISSSGTESFQIL